MIDGWLLLLGGGLLALLVLTRWRRVTSPRAQRTEWERLARTLRIVLVLCVLIPAVLVYMVSGAILTLPFVPLVRTWLDQVVPLVRAWLTTLSETL